MRASITAAVTVVSASLFVASCAVGLRQPLTLPDPADPGAPVAPHSAVGRVLDATDPLADGPASTASTQLLASTGTATGTATTRYVCPMHKQVVSDQPGRCPLCHMALRPVVEGAR